MVSRGVIVSVPIWNTIKIFFFAVIYTVWISVKSIVQHVWNRNGFPKAVIRDNPPPILVDSSIGRHSYIKIKGVKFHYVEAGSMGSPPVLLLHGFPDCWVGWRSQLQVLASTHRVLALDLMGYGDSDKPISRIRYRPESLLEPLKILLKGLMVQPPHRPPVIIGHDLGGLLGWYLVHDAPELVDRLVIVSSPHPNVFWETLQPTSPFNMAWMYAAQVPWLPEQAALRRDLSLFERCYPHLPKNDTNSSGSLLEAYKYVFSRWDDWAGPINYYRNLIFWRVAADDYGSVNTPTLLITGNKDPQVSLESIVRSAEWCNHGIVKIVDGAGHFPHQEFPNHFNRLILDFLITKKKDGMNDFANVGMRQGLVNRVLGAVHLFT